MQIHTLIIGGQKYSEFQLTLNGVLNLLECIRKSKNDPVLINIGTDEEYGDIVNGSFIEHDMLKPSSPYSASKAASSLLALEDSYVLYLTTNEFNQSLDSGIRYDDKELNINLPDNIIISEKDKKLKHLNELTLDF